MSNRIIYWFRNDLRLTDNEAFWKAVSDSDEIIPVYVFDPRKYRLRDLGFRKTGLHRARHTYAAVSNLRERLLAKGADLLIRVGEPEKVVSELANFHSATEVRASKEITLEETNIEASLSKKLKGINVDISLTWMATLVHPHDLPFYVSRLPDSYARFAELVGKVPVRDTASEQEFKRIVTGETGTGLPHLTELGFTEDELAGTMGQPERCEHEEEADDLLTSGKAGVDEVLNLISSGLVSPRQAFHRIGDAAAREQLYTQLLWRDYLQFVVLRYGTRLFKPSGVAHKIDRIWSYDREVFDRWREGRTPDPVVNRYMEQLYRSGVLGQEEFLAAARYLVEEAGIVWTWGACWFESSLKYYDVASNWGNWNVVAGVGPQEGIPAGAQQ